MQACLHISYLINHIFFDNSRAITYHKYRILQSCFTGWWRMIAASHQRAVQLRRYHLLKQGWRAFRWNMMLGHELAKTGIWHHQRWKHRRVFLKVRNYISIIAVYHCRHEIIGDTIFYTVQKVILSMLLRKLYM